MEMSSFTHIVSPPDPGSTYCLDPAAFDGNVNPSSSADSNEKLLKLIQRHTDELDINDRRSITGPVRGIRSVGKLAFDQEKPVMASWPTSISVFTTEGFGTVRDSTSLRHVALQKEGTFCISHQGEDKKSESDNANSLRQCSVNPRGFLTDMLLSPGDNLARSLDGSSALSTIFGSNRLLGWNGISTSLESLQSEKDESIFMEFSPNQSLVAEDFFEDGQDMVLMNEKIPGLEENDDFIHNGTAVPSLDTSSSRGIRSDLFQNSALITQMFDLQLEEHQRQKYAQQSGNAEAQNHSEDLLNKRSAVVSDNSSTNTESAIRGSIPGSDSTQQQPQSKSGRRTVKRWSKAGAGRRSNFTKGQWTPDEDRYLKQLVKELGDKKWSEIAQHLRGRIGKQCRERWQNHLKPNIKNESWTLQEEDLLIRLHRELGSKWAEIAKRIPGRTENNIKNLWNATKRRKDARRKSRRTINGSEIEAPKLNHLREYIMSVEAQKAKSRNNSELNDRSQGCGREGDISYDSDTDMLSNITCDLSSKWNSTGKFPISSQTSIHSGLHSNVEQILEQILQNGNVGTNVVQHPLQPCALNSFDAYKPHSPITRNLAAGGWGLAGARNGSNNHASPANVNNRNLWEFDGGGDMAKTWNVGGTMEFPDLDAAFFGSSSFLHHSIPPSLTACSCCEDNPMATQKVETFPFVSEASSPIPNLRKCNEKLPPNTTVVAGTCCRNMMMTDLKLFPEFMELDSNDISFGSPSPAATKKQPVDVELQSQNGVIASTDFIINAVASYEENNESFGQKKQSSSDAATMFGMSGTIITDRSVHQNAATPFWGSSPFSLLEIENSISTGVLDRFKRWIGPVMVPKNTATREVDLIEMISES